MPQPWPTRRSRRPPTHRRWPSPTSSAIARAPRGPAPPSTRASTRRATENYGGRDEMRVGNGRVSLLRFDLRAIAVDATVFSATLHITVSPSDALEQGYVAIAPLHESWTRAGGTRRAPSQEPSSKKITSSSSVSRQVTSVTPCFMPGCFAIRGGYARSVSRVRRGNNPDRPLPPLRRPPRALGGEHVEQLRIAAEVGDAQQRRRIAGVLLHGRPVARDPRSSSIHSSARRIATPRSRAYASRRQSSHSSDVGTHVVQSRHTNASLRTRRDMPRRSRGGRRDAER